MKFMLTNDDGIDAPGLVALCAAAQMLGEAIVVAPLQEFSGCSHRVSTHEPVRVERRGLDRYAIDGTPADCVRLGLHHVAGLQEALQRESRRGKGQFIPWNVGGLHQLRVEALLPGAEH